MLWPPRLMPSMGELAAFEAAARHGSFSPAAVELALTQSAVSKQVQHLEATLGVPLFERQNRRVGSRRLPWLGLGIIGPTGGMLADKMRRGA